MMSVAWISSGAAALAASIPAIRASPMLPAPMMAIFFPRAMRRLMLRMALGVEAHQLFVDQRPSHLADLDHPAVIRVNPAGADFDVVTRREAGPRPDPADVAGRQADGDAGRHQGVPDLHPPIPDLGRWDDGTLAREQVVAGRAVRCLHRHLRVGGELRDLHGRVSVTMPCCVATTARSARPTKRPVQTTRGVFSNSVSSLAGSSIFGNHRSRM